MNTNNDENTKILIDIATKKLEIESEIKKMEKHIYDLESKYLEMTQSTGNIIKGWEQIFVPKPKINTQTVQNNFKRQRLAINERIFSQTSYANPLLKEESQVNSNSPGIIKFKIGVYKNGSLLNGGGCTNFLKRKKKMNSLSLKKKKTNGSSFKLNENDINDE